MLRPTAGYAPIWLDKPTWASWWKWAPVGPGATGDSGERGGGGRGLSHVGAGEDGGTVLVLPPTGRGLDEQGDSSYWPLLGYPGSWSWSPGAP